MYMGKCMYKISEVKKDVLRYVGSNLKGSVCL